MTAVMIQKNPRRVLSDEDKYSFEALRVIERNLESPNSPPTRLTVYKICIDETIVDTSYMEEILRYLIGNSDLSREDLRPLCAHLQLQHVVVIFNVEVTERRRRELTDWKPRWPSVQ